MTRLKLYKVSADYLDSIREIEPKVSLLKERRPFLGILITIDSNNYLAPLTSPKPKHKTMKNLEDFIKIDSGNYGAINLNNMIPVPETKYEEININEEKDNFYKILLQNQLTWCNKNKEIIIKKAENLRNKKLNEKLRKELNDRICDFEKLENFVNSNQH
ncbi:MAG: type III toxin-antitoxin system ToxN/AbiQ family toxin [Leptotrichiaceae bacterium]|nr:type III toxin-antitoxin system ToxN/AbiQ family toxin [Leptotrichiaceae bacterium]